MAKRNTCGKRFGVIDTGGIIPHDDALIPTEILKQAQVALDLASHILYVIDGRTEITAADRDLVKLLRPLNKPLSLVVNKIDAQSRENLVHEFYSLGLGERFCHLGRAPAWIRRLARARDSAVPARARPRRRERDGGRGAAN